MNHYDLKRSCIAFVIAILVSGTAHAQLPGEINLAKPGDREFVLDLADMIGDADEQKIKQLADKLLTDKGAPIVVVTIESMAKHGGAGLRIETFARLLFDQWGIGPAKIDETPWNYGILLLVSKEDRKARIELGAGWKRDKDIVAEQIMNDAIVSRFKRGDFSGGIVAGVEWLDKMARELQLPGAAQPGSRTNQTPHGTGGPRPTSHYIIGLVFVGIVIFTIVSLIRRGSGGWAWLMWAGIFGVIGYMLYQMATQSRHRGGGGGGFSGGSFGGGFSGGGGATGSW
ncbi:MAG: TPM domain-containing protein [Planctomycetaceae bacterium]